MNIDEARQFLPAQVEVGHELIAVAKRFVIEHFSSDVAQLTAAWLSHMQATMPLQVVIHPSADTEAVLRQAARSISCRLALYEALWGLIHANVLFLASVNLQVVTPNLEWTTVFQRSGGQSSGWTFDEFAMGIPLHVLRAPSWNSAAYRPLSEGDLYVQEIGIANLHPLVAESLQEAVACFRQDLYTPALAMLTRAVEGAWTEMGLAVTDVVRARSEKRGESVANELVDPQFSLARRLSRVGDLYDQKDLCEEIWTDSDVKPRDLRQVAIWADQVRDARNVLHYQAQPAMANTYEKVATLLIAAIPCLRTVYAVHDSAKQLTADRVSGTNGG